MHDAMVQTTLALPEQLASQMHMHHVGHGTQPTPRESVLYAMAMLGF